MRLFCKIKNHRGFSLVELLVALAITAIIGVAMYSTFESQSRSFVKQEQTIEVQQSIRGAMEIMVYEIRMAGYDPGRSQLFWPPEDNPADPAIFDIRPVSGRPALTFRADFNEGNPSGTQGVVDGGDAIQYVLYDSTVSPAGILDLGRRAPNLEPLIGYAEELAFAYAYDNNDDGDVDLTANSHIIWAIDSNGDNQLDVNLDTNDDGVLDGNDNPAGTALATPVNPNRIRAVRIWLLVRSARDERNTMLDTRTYVLGERRFTPAGDERFFQRRLLSETVWLRNAGTGAF